ncbi:MAG: hypothetical protein K9N51_12550 [Candidatus Pacebacteria bacterium]|nr:hypothetical protein [Candidatus Paceibacterota bacterium]
MAATPYQVAFYEPQIETYDGDRMTGRAAVSVAHNQDEPAFGAVWFDMRLRVDRNARTAVVSEFRVTTLRLPGDAAVDTNVIGTVLRQGMEGIEVAFDPLLRSLEREKAELEAAAAGADAVPDILWVPHPAVVIHVDGEPVLEELPGTDLFAVTNTDAFMVMQKRSGQWFLQVGNEYLTASDYIGPWRDALTVPVSVARAAEEEDVKFETTFDKPRVIVATRPTELLMTDGEPRYAVIPGTSLLYVVNTDADVFLEIGEQKHYVLLAGRWFASPSLMQGPWQVVPPEALPVTFANIPPDAIMGGVLASVPGTEAAHEAVQEAQIPTVQSVAREAVTVNVEYYGDPDYERIGATDVYYAVNTPYSVLRVFPYYYLCLDGVWYRGRSSFGPWSVCIDVPTVIYTIPPYYPVYPVTYVRVYDWTPRYVYVGYTAGYLGWHVGWRWGGLVFGFAYYDDDWHRHHHYRHHRIYRRRYTHYGPPRRHGYRYYRRRREPDRRHFDRDDISHRGIEHKRKREFYGRSPANYFRDKERRTDWARRSKGRSRDGVSDRHRGREISRTESRDARGLGDGHDGRGDYRGDPRESQWTSKREWSSGQEKERDTREVGRTRDEPADKVHTDRREPSRRVERVRRAARSSEEEHSADRTDESRSKEARKSRWLVIGHSQEERSDQASMPPRHAGDGRRGSDPENRMAEKPAPPERRMEHNIRGREKRAVSDSRQDFVRRIEREEKHAERDVAHAKRDEHDRVEWPGHRKESKSSRSIDRVQPKFEVDEPRQASTDSVISHSVVRDERKQRDSKRLHAEIKRHVEKTRRSERPKDRPVVRSKPKPAAKVGRAPARSRHSHAKSEEDTWDDLGSFASNSSERHSSHDRRRSSERKAKPESRSSRRFGGKSRSR